MPFELDTLARFDNLLPLMAIAGLMILGLTLIYASSGERTKTMSKRIDRLRGGQGASGAESAKRRPGARLSPQGTQQLTEADHRQIIRIFGKFGAPPEKALTYFTMTRALLPVVFGVAALPLTMGLFARSPAAGLLATVMPAAIGWFLPIIIVRRGIARRSKAVSAGLPDALELLAVCIEAGLSLENGLQRVSSELKRSLPDLADELALTWAEINILPERDQALLNFAERVNADSVRSVVSALSQALRYGTPLARSLRVVAADVRTDQLTAMEEKANRLPAMMTVPVMLFIMPTIFLIIGGPAALKLMDIFWGHH